MMNPQSELLLSHLIKLEEVMRIEQLWSVSFPPKAALSSKLPFAVDTLKIEQWLQFIFIPKIKNLIESGQSLPSKLEILPVLELSLNEQEYPLLVKAINDLDLLFAQGSQF